MTQATPSPVAEILNSLPPADNLAIWNSNRTPDRSATKEFKRSGGFNGTAINAVYLIRCATELWGPMGGAWGIRVVDEKIIEGATHVIGDNMFTDKVYVIRAELYYPGGTVPSYGQTIFAGVNKYGPYTDEEAPKKTLTDALTKALSWLGFASDIHMGLWDDNKHVNNQVLAEARKRAIAAGLTPAGAAAAALELTQGASQSFNEIPSAVLQRIASAGLSAETVSKWNGAQLQASATATAAVSA